MRIAVDVDGVLADRVGSVLDWVNERHGTRLTPDDVTEWEFSIPEAGTDIEAVIHELAAQDPDHVLGLSPIDGGIEAMEELAREHELLIATHRDPSLHDRTERWLTKHGVPYDRFLPECGDGKVDVSADVLIDDHTYNVRRFAEHRGRAVLFDQPWNSNTAGHTNVAVADGWEEVLRHLR